MERVLVDTNVLINFILKTKLTGKARGILRSLLTGSTPVIFTNVFEETVYILIREELNSKGVSKFFDQRDYISKSGYFNLEIYKKFFKFLEKASIPVLENKFRIPEFVEIMENYRLLPNDALIAATCKHYGIRKIATFDEDFKRVDFLEVVEV